MNTFKNRVLAGAIRVQNNVYMKAISNAMMGLMPIMMISSIASLINTIDIGNTQQIMDQIGLKSLLTQINAMTIDVISVYVAFLVGYKLAEHLNADQLNAGIMSLVFILDFKSHRNIRRDQSDRVFRRWVLVECSLQCSAGY